MSISQLMRTRRIGQLVTLAAQVNRGGQQEEKRDRDPECCLHPKARAPADGIRCVAEHVPCRQHHVSTLVRSAWQPRRPQMHGMMGLSHQTLPLQ